MTSLRTYVRANWLWVLVHVGSLLPLFLLLWDQSQGNLSINPIDDYTDRTGSTAIILLLLSLAVTPVQTITGWRQINTIRRALGLYAFGYGLLHMLVFVGLDYGFSLEFILLDGLPTKPYILVGLAALLLMLPLALTSTKAAMKRLGRNWKKLHRLAYAAGILAVIHFIWVKKLPFGEPTIYAFILAFLLVARIPVVRAWLTKLRPKKNLPPPSPARKAPKPKVITET